MFNSYYDEYRQEKDSNKILKTNNEELKSKIKELETAHNELRRNYDSNERILAAEHASDKRILDSELQTRINDAVKEQKEVNSKLIEDNAVLRKEVSILEKAFENMGFDVKDMKGILNKLADAVVAKNQIKLVK